MKKNPVFKIGQLLTHSYPDIQVVNGRLQKVLQPRPVKLLAQSGNWAMVKRTEYRGTAPYCCMLKELAEPLQPQTKDDV